MDQKEREARQIERMGRRESQRCEAEPRQAASQDFEALRERLDSIDRTVSGYIKQIAKAVDASLTALGFHRHHRGEWQRRRKPMLAADSHRYPMGAVPLTESERLAQRARNGDAAALETVLLEAERHHHETVEAVLLQALSHGSGPPYSDRIDYVAVKLIEMRYDLAPPGSSRAEKLLAERATLCWQHMEVLEYEAARLFHRREMDTRKAEVIDRRLTHSQARLGQALTALAKIRRLNLPANCRLTLETSVSFDSPPREGRESLQRTVESHPGRENLQ